MSVRMSIHEYECGWEKYVNLVINVTRYSEEETEARMGTSINIFHSIVTFQTENVQFISNFHWIWSLVIAILKSDELWHLRLVDLVNLRFEMILMSSVSKA